ncbi:DUF3291 domain-containing protein [Endozoicomonas sp. OPT23]|uniref:DUF3291 domain-containing protein n=1 Tax=Endozoicomonas sp. OPT23 TaxID=2072845 RepID=UPI00129B0C97
MESETMRRFVDRLDEINALADVSPDFVWRLQPEREMRQQSTLTELNTIQESLVLCLNPIQRKSWPSLHQKISVNGSRRITTQRVNSG